jgi:hypothetical protein
MWASGPRKSGTLPAPVAAMKVSPPEEAIGGIRPLVM